MAKSQDPAADYIRSISTPLSPAHLSWPADPEAAALQLVDCCEKQFGWPAPEGIEYVLVEGTTDGQKIVLTIRLKPTREETRATAVRAFSVAYTKR